MVIRGNTRATSSPSFKRSGGGDTPKSSPRKTTIKSKAPKGKDGKTRVKRYKTPAGQVVYTLNTGRFGVTNYEPLVTTELEQVSESDSED